VTAQVFGSPEPRAGLVHEMQMKKKSYAVKSRLKTRERPKKGAQASGAEADSKKRGHRDGHGR